MVASNTPNNDPKPARQDWMHILKLFGFPNCEKWSNLMTTLVLNKFHKFGTSDENMEKLSKNPKHLAMMKEAAYASMMAEMTGAAMVGQVADEPGYAPDPGEWELPDEVLAVVEAFAAFNIKMAKIYNGSDSHPQDDMGIFEALRFVMTCMSNKFKSAVEQKVAEMLGWKKIKKEDGK